MPISARTTLTGLFVLTFGLAAAHSEARHDEASARMAKAAETFLAGLDEAQRARASFAFDSPLRGDWHFIPRERKGLPLGELDGAERARFDALLASGFSAQGRAAFDGVVKLEGLLRKLESKPGAPALMRDPGNYAVAIFGTPGVDPWGWRLEGHHWTAHFTCVDAQVIAVTPEFVGANPARVADGPDAGFELLGAEDAQACAFVKALKPEQLARARLAGALPQDVLLDPSKARLDTPRQGICSKDLDGTQLAALLAIVDHHFADLSDELATRERERFAAHSLDTLYFAWSGDAEGKRPWYWRVEGEYFAIEFVYPRGDSNHAHRIWRDFERDLGGDPLREHLAQER